MGWKVVEVNTDEYLQLHLNNLLIRRSKEKILINIRDIDLLILHNDRCLLSAKLLNALTEQNVSVIFMNNKHEPCSNLVPIKGNHNSLKILAIQIGWTSFYKGSTWQKIIKNKISNQTELLACLEINVRHKEFQKLIEETKHFDVTNREGHAAKMYWHDLFGMDFIRDQKGIENSVINAMLNYGYAILRTLTTTAIIKAGLDSRISFFHKSFTNFFALASDIMEPFRPLIDEIVYKHANDKIFSFKTRDELIGIATMKVKIQDKSYFLSQALSMICLSIIKGKGWLWINLWD